MASDSRRSMSGCVDPRNVRSKPVLPVARRTSARSIPLIRIPFARTSRLTSLPLDRQAGGLRRVHPHFPALQSDPSALSGASHRKQTLCINWISVTTSAKPLLCGSLETRLSMLVRIFQRLPQTAWPYTKRLPPQALAWNSGFHLMADNTNSVGFTALHLIQTIRSVPSSVRRKP